MSPSFGLLSTLNPHHPRLLSSISRWQELQIQAKNDGDLHRFLLCLEQQARALESIEPVVYEKEGYRLLAVSRQALRRVLLLSFQFRISGEEKFARRAEQEMLAASAFGDWNPSHFLDTGEMMTALAIGYDWLYDWLSVESRQTIRTAIIEKGLQTGLATTNVFHQIENNWNQVCWCGMALGALAIAEDEPQLAAQCLQLVKDFNHHGLRPYQPAGVYPEGPMYWSYGTSFQVMLLASLQSALGEDWGLGNSAGFMESATAFVQFTAPSGDWFNFFDCVLRGEIEPALFWFAQELHQDDLLQFERAKIAELASSKSGNEAEDWREMVSGHGRLLPLAALWWPQAQSKAQLPLPLCWNGDGVNPVAVFRSAWHDANAMYLAVKGGSAALNHGHMDAGSFVFGAKNVRWAHDLGMQDYHSLESKGIKMWNSEQEGERWKVFRFGPFSHNTLTINGHLHRCDGQAVITHFHTSEKTSLAVVDLTPTFEGQATRVTRGWLFRPDQHVVIRDELEGLNAGDLVRWAMVTKAEISLHGRAAILTQDGQQLSVHLLTPEEATFSVLPADLANHAFNAPNPRTRILVVDAIATSSGALQIQVVLQVDERPVDKKDLGLLKIWSEP